MKILSDQDSLVIFRLYRLISKNLFTNLIQTNDHFVLLLAVNNCRLLQMGKYRTTTCCTRTNFLRRGINLTVNPKKFQRKIPVTHNPRHWSTT